MVISLSEHLEIISLRKNNEELRTIITKQANSIAELCCLLVDISNKMSEIQSDSEKSELFNCFEFISNLITLKSKRATNYLYMRTDEDTVQ